MAQSQSERLGTQEIVRCILASTPNDSTIDEFDQVKDALYDAQAKVSEAQWKRIYSIHHCKQMFTYERIKSCPNVARRLLYLLFNPTLANVAYAIARATDEDGAEAAIVAYETHRDRRVG